MESMLYLLLICQVMLGAILLIAATGKLFNSEQLAVALRLSHTPQILLKPIVVLAPTLELC